MFPIWLLVCLCAVTSAVDYNASSLQLANFAAKAKEPIGILTTDSGAPIEKRNMKSFNSKLLHKEGIMDSISHIVRERIPERPVHAKGTGAFGYFESTCNFSNYTKAKLFSEKGKKTKVAVRFSIGGGRAGTSDIARGVRGMAIKFYTEEGNLDFVGLNIPVLVFKDPIKFVTFTHAFKSNPVTALDDVNAQWDYATQNPESIYATMMISGDQGLPKNYRCMSGHPIHTYELCNNEGEIFFARFHFKSNLPFEYWTNEEAAKLALDPDYFVRDLYNAIENGNYPTWTVYVQLLTLKQFLEDNPTQIIDLTRTLSEEKYPLIPIGELFLNENQKNHFADVEQSAYCPGNLVPGILGAPDKAFEARRLAYRDSQYYRLGSNFKRIPVNCPLRALSLSRDGVPYLGDNYGGIPNYYPNSYNGPVPYEDQTEPDLIVVYEEDRPDNFDQARALYAQGMSEGERERMINNIVSGLSKAEIFLQERAIQIFTTIHAEFGHKVADQLGLNYTSCSSEDYDY